MIRRGNRRRRPSGRETDPVAGARAQVKAPALLLFLAAVLWGSTVLIFLTFPLLRPAQNSDPTAAAVEASTVVWGIGILLANAGIATGAMRMYQLRNRRLAYGAAILAVIPCMSPGYIVGLPLGIWAIVVLRRPEVTAAFK